MYLIAEKHIHIYKMFIIRQCWISVLALGTENRYDGEFMKSEQKLHFS